MSDQRPKWMPSIWSVDRLCGGISELEPFVSVEMRRTGLRAQIAVLEEMKDVFTRQASTVTEEISWTLKSVRYSLENKIAALRKELGQ